MMKIKTGVWCLAFLILCIGIQIDFHFSGSEFYSFALFGDAKSCCEGSCDCCHNESIYLLIDMDFNNPGTVNLPVNFKTWQDYIPLTCLLPPGSQLYGKDQYLFPDSPPLIGSNNKPALYQVFRC